MSSVVTLSLFDFTESASHCFPSQYGGLQRLRCARGPAP